MTRNTKASAGEIDFVAQHGHGGKHSMTIEPGSVAIDEFARRARIGRISVFEEIKFRRLRAAKVGNRTVIPIECARAWLKAHPSPATAA
jgi:Holliday junction resolvase-like predicted endonuclease